MRAGAAGTSLRHLPLSPVQTRCPFPLVCLVCQVSRMLGPQVPGGEDVVDSLLGKVDQLKVRW